jgi:outer membrane protein
MNQFIKFIITLQIMGLITIAPVFAQTDIDYKNISFKTALDVALKNNRQIKARKQNLEIAKTETKITAEEKLPEINFSANYNRLTNLQQYEAGGIFSEAKEYETYYAMYGVGVDAEMLLYAGGTLKYKDKIAKLQESRNQILVDKTEKEIKLNTITAFLEIYHQLEQLNLIKANIQEDQALEKQISIMKKEGLVTQNEILRTQLQLANHKMELNKIKNNISIAEDFLKTNLALNPEIELHVDTNSLIEMEVGLAKISASNYISLEKNDDLRLSSNEIDVLNYNKKMVLANYMPKLWFVADYNFKYPNYMFFPPEPYLYRLGLIGLNLKFSISDLYKNKAKVKKADQEIALNKLEHHELEAQINHKIFSTKTKFKEAEDNIELATVSVRQATENYRLVKLKYKNQLSLITELLDANNSLMKAKATLISSKIDRKLKYYQYKFTTGDL